MKITKPVLLAALFLISSYANSQGNIIDKSKIEEDLNDVISAIKHNYIYLEDKKIDLNCIQKSYRERINLLRSKDDILLLFEYLLNELYDNHASLMVNNQSSYRLDSPLFVVTANDKTIIQNIWQTQIEGLDVNVIGAEIIQFNGVNFNQKIDEFPTACIDKELNEARNWISNKVIAGRYNEARNLTIKLESGKVIELDLDKIKIKNNSDLLSIHIINNTGIIRINNSLGQSALIKEFDSAINALNNTKGLIIDLRNTPGGGGTYVARGLMGRFIDKELPYQKHQIFDETYDNQTPVKRSWVEIVSPRAKQYTKPVAILVGRWTGSMGEGLAIGFDGMQRAEVVGTEMKRLAGGSTFDFTTLLSR